MIDDRTTHLNLPKPNLANTLLEDVARLREAMDTLDAQVNGKQATIGFTPENVAVKGQANGYTPLGGDGKVPAAYLPSYVDDLVEYANAAAFPTTGESGRIYLALDTNAQYRWSGSAYVQITASPGTTDDVPEGSANLYFTDARARAAQVPATAVTTGVVKVGAGFSVALDGTISLDMGTSFSETVVPVSANGQTDFVVDGGYISGSVIVLLNGVELLRADDYTATDGVNLTLAHGINTTDTLLVRTWRAYLNTGPVSIPGTPVNTSPVNSATVDLARPTFTGGVFSAPDGATHAATQLQISTVSNFASTVYDSGSLAPSTSVTIGGAVLSTSTLYYWRMRYQSSGGQWSVWSTPTTFTTAAVLASYINTPAATPTAFGAPFEGGYYAGLIWNEVTRSATSVAIGTGSKTFTVTDNQNTTPQFYVGQQVEVRSRSNSTNNKMFGLITFAGGTTLTVNVTTSSGSGSFADWSVMAQYRVIVAPKASGEAASLTYSDGASSPAASDTPSEGLKATIAITNAGTPSKYPAAWFCHNLVIGNLTDWYLPSMCELELAYRNLKPHASNNSISSRAINVGSNLYGDTTESGTSASGVNNNSSPVGAAYTNAGAPFQVAAGVNFRTGESEAFEMVNYLTSSKSVFAQNFSNGAQSNINQTTASRVRAIRRSII